MSTPVSTLAVMTAALTIAGAAASPLQAIYVFDSNAGWSFVYTTPTLLSPGTRIDPANLTECTAPRTCLGVAFGDNGQLEIAAREPGRTVARIYQFAPSSFSTPGVYNSHRVRGGDSGHLAVLWTPVETTTTYLYDFQSDGGDFLFLSPNLVQPGTSFSAGQLNSCTSFGSLACSQVSFNSDGELGIAFTERSGRVRRIERFDYSPADFSTPGVFHSAQGSSPSTLRIIAIAGAAAPTPESGTGLLLGFAGVVFGVAQCARKLSASAKMFHTTRS